jgi:hypothetical protein
MTDMTYDLAQRMTPDAAGSRRAGTSAARRRHAASFSDGVIAAYIHEISARHPASPATKGSKPFGGGARRNEPCQARLPASAGPRAIAATRGETR